MSISAVWFTVLSASIAFPALAKQIEIPTPTSQIFAPAGLTEADNAVVVLSGQFTDTCHKVGDYKVSIDAEQRHIVIDAKSTTQTDAVCALRMVPFAQAIQLGSLEPGDYTISLANRPEVNSEVLTIEPNSGDEPNFASVRDASVNISASGEQTLTLMGDYPFAFVGCAVMGSVDVKQVDERLLIVEPVLKLVTDNAACMDWTPQFSVEHALSFPLPAGDVVLFIKTAEGTPLVRVASVTRQ